MGDPYNRTKNKDSLFSNTVGSCLWIGIPANTTTVELSWVGHSLVTEVSQFRIFIGEIENQMSNSVSFDGVVRIAVSQEFKVPTDRPAVKLGICVTKSQENTPVEIIRMAFIFSHHSRHLEYDEMADATPTLKSLIGRSFNKWD